MKRILALLAVASLAVALLLSGARTKSSQSAYLQELEPDATEFTVIAHSPPVYAATAGDGQLVGYVAFGQAQGYGGPLRVAVSISSDGTIQEVMLLEQSETPTFLDLVFRKGFLNQFSGRSVTESFTVGRDVDGATGATITSRGLSRAVQGVAHQVATGVMGLEVPTEAVGLQFGLPEAAALLVMAMALASALIWPKQQKLRTVTLAASVAVVGFWLVRPLSVSNLASLLMGFWPPLMENPLWYLLVLFAVLPPLLLGKNIYCYWFCPFYGMQEVAHKVGGTSFSCRHQVEKRLRLARYILLWLALFLAFSLRNPGLGSYEPFAGLFGLKAKGIMWVLLPVVLVGAALRHRFWCNYFCPVGAFLDLTVQVNRFVTRLIGGRKWITAPQSKESSSSVSSSPVP